MHNGTTIMELIDTVTELFRAHAHEFEVCRGCKNFDFECDCPTYGDSWKAALEDDPARGAR